VPQKTGRKIPSPFALAQQKSVAAPPAPESGEPNTPNENPMQSDHSMIDEWTDTAPPEYGTKSTLEVEIKSGDNVFDVEMVRQPGK
jgi:hypothetical protein